MFPSAGKEQIEQVGQVRGSMHCSTGNKQMKSTGRSHNLLDKWVFITHLVHKQAKKKTSSKHYEDVGVESRRVSSQLF